MRYFLLAAVAVFLLGISNASAIGISPAMQKINFVPNYTAVFTFAVSGTENFSIRVEGPESQYMEFKEPVRVREYFTVDMALKLPEDLRGGGEHSNNILVLEKPLVGGGITGLTGVNSRFTILVPYRGLYLTMTFDAQDANVGEDINFYMQVANGGEEPAKIKGRVDVYQYDKLVGSVDSEESELKSTQDASIHMQLNTTQKELKRGVYKAVATLFYNGKTMQKEDEFRVGDFEIEVINYTNRIFSGEINPVFVEVGNLWNGQIENIYAEMRVFNSTREIGSFKTATYSMDKWAKAKLTTHIDAKDVGIGNYTNNISVFFGGKAKSGEYNLEIVGRVLLTQENSDLLIQVAILVIVAGGIWILARKISGRKGKKPKRKRR